MSLRELQATTAAVRLDIELRTGRIRADIKAPEGRMVDFTVRSPIATASVRGTAFEFDTVNLRVNDGIVVFFGADNTAVYVAAGESSSPDPVSGKAAVPVETAAAQAPPPPAGVETIGVAPPAVSGPMSPVTPVNVTLSWGD
jgi:hypothetical protein